MAKKSKTSRGSNETGRDGGAAVTLLSLSSIAAEKPSTAEGLEDGGGPNVPRDDSDACSPPVVPDLCIPPLKTQKKKKKKRNSIDTVDVGLSGEGIEENRKGSSETVDVPLSVEGKEKIRKKRKSSNDILDTGQNGEEEKQKRQKKRKSSCDTVDAGLNGEVEEEMKKRKSSSDTFDAGLNVEVEEEMKKRKSNSEAWLNGGVEEEMKNRSNSSGPVDAWLSSLEEKEKKKKKKKKKRRGSSDMGDECLNGEVEMGTKNKKEKCLSTDMGTKKKKKEKGLGNDVELKNVCGGESVVADVGEVRQDIPSALSEDPGSALKKKKKRDRATDDAGRDVVIHRSPAGRTESNEGISEAAPSALSEDPGPVLKKKKKKDRANDDAGPDVVYRSPAGRTKSNEGMSEADGEVVLSKRKKTVRFQEPSSEPSSNVPDENVTYVLREGTEDDIAYFSEERNWKKDIVRPGLLYGKFTKEEDEKLKTSVHNYIKMRGWDDKGLQIVFNTSQHGAVARGCWLEIAKCLPARPVKQIHSRAIRLLGGHKRGKWSAEELEMLTNLQTIHGNDWRKIASSMERSADVIKDKWRHLRICPTRRTGAWTQDELDQLCKLVRRSLKIKESLPLKILDRRRVRDDISWEWISEQMQRDSSACAELWYSKLASPMISAEKWANGDDRLLLQRLMEFGAASEEALDWETVLDHRDGELCAGRWKEMTKLLGKSDHVSFEEKLELLAQRYAPDLLGIEEEF